MFFIKARYQHYCLIPLMYEAARSSPFGLSGVEAQLALGFDSAQPERQIKVVICCSFIQNWSKQETRFLG